MRATTLKPRNTKITIAITTIRIDIKVTASHVRKPITSSSAPI
jgi:hypothetical protein